MIGKVPTVLSLLLCLAPMASLRATEPAAPGAWAIPARALEAHAEDSIDVLTARHPNAAKLERLTRDMETSLNRLKGAAAVNTEAKRRTNQAEASLRALRDGVRQRAYVKAALAANQITMVLLPIEGYPTAEHREVALLDCLSREITLLNQDDPVGQAEALRDRKAQVDATWKLLRPWYASRKGTSKLVGEVDTCVTRIGSSSEPQAQIAAGRRLGDLVDELETYLPRRA